MHRKYEIPAIAKDTNDAVKKQPKPEPPEFLLSGGLESSSFWDSLGFFVCIRFSRLFSSRVLKNGC